MPLNPIKVADAIKASVGNAKFKKYSDGRSLFLLTRNGLGYWRLQYRDGASFKSKVLGSAGSTGLSPAAARQAREAHLVRLRETRKGATMLPVPTGAPIARTVPIAAAGEPAGEPLSALLSRFLIEQAPYWKDGRALLAGKSEHEVAHLIDADKAGKGAMSYRRMFARLPTNILEMDALGIPPLAYRAACKTIWPDSPDSVARMVKRLGTLQTYRNTGAVKGFKPKSKNHPALRYNEVPKFMADLAGRDHVGARGLRWTILTAVRSAETRFATWGEIIEMDGRPCWYLSAERMKAENSHTVPLTQAMLDIIGPRPMGKGAMDVALFPGARGARFCNNGLMLEELRKTYPAKIADVHGFRSSFRSWAADCTEFTRDVCEKALAHVVPGVEGDYNRGELLAKRRKLMDAWSAYCIGG